MQHGQPTRREFLAATAGAAGARPAPRRPNLVYLLADQLRYFSCGYAGDPHAATLHIDRLAGQSISLRQAVSSSPICAPYRASLMTGKYTSTTGMVINELRLSPGHDCFAHVLTRAGYQTAYIGKWHLWANQLGNHQQTINGFVPPGPYRLGFDGLWAAYNFNHNYYQAPFFRDRPERELHPGYEPDSQTTMAIDFLRRQAGAGQPFSLFLSWGTPHDPWNWNNVPAEYAERFRQKKIPPRPNHSGRSDPYADTWGALTPEYPQQAGQFMQAYYAMTANLDWNLGRLMQALADAGLDQDTIVVFTSDHGEMFGSQGRRAKNVFYDEAIRVPFLVRWPGRIKAGGVSDALLGTPDIMPTLLSLMDLPVPRGVEGGDVSRAVLGRSGPRPDAAYLQGMGTTAAWRDGHEWRALRDERCTYAVYRRDRSELLFDRRADPYQMKNLAGEQGSRGALEHCRARLQRWMKEMNDTFETCTWYRDHWTEDRNILRGARGGSHDLEQLRRIVQATYPAGG
jgi:arylsulfatase A-like enzyme